MNTTIIDKRLVNMAKTGITYATVTITLKPEFTNPIDLSGFELEYWMKLVPAMMGKLSLNKLDYISYMPEVESIELPMHKTTTKPWEITNY